MGKIRPANSYNWTAGHTRMYTLGRRGYGEETAIIHMISTWWGWCKMGFKPFLHCKILIWFHWHYQLENMDKTVFVHITHLQFDLCLCVSGWLIGLIWNSCGAQCAQRLYNRSWQQSKHSLVLCPGTPASRLFTSSLVIFLSCASTPFTDLLSFHFIVSYCHCEPD